MSGFSILIITLPPLRGGVPTKARILANHLRSVGNRVSIAHYATFSDYRPLVCPSWSFLSGKKPFVEESQCFGNFQSYAVGCFFPELEFTYYCSSELWRHVFQNFDRFIIVSGTVLLANPLTEMRVPYFVWCASTVADDRSDRARAMPVFRRIFDSVCVSNGYFLFYGSTNADQNLQNFVKNLRQTHKLKTNYQIFSCFLKDVEKMFGECGLMNSTKLVKVCL